MHISYVQLDSSTAWLRTPASELVRSIQVFSGSYVQAQSRHT